MKNVVLHNLERNKETHNTLQSYKGDSFQHFDKAGKNKNDTSQNILIPYPTPVLAFARQ